MNIGNMSPSSQLSRLVRRIDLPFIFRPLRAQASRRAAFQSCESSSDRNPVLSMRKYSNMSKTWRDTKAQREQEMRSNEARSMERNFTRDWKVGDVYAPHDLSAAEARKWKKRYSPTTDAFDALSLNPLDLYKNFAVMSEYMTEMGRIRPASSTGLRRVNQRKIAKAIRRAIALGLMPSVHKHPEIIREQEIRASINRGGTIL